MLTSTRSLGLSANIASIVASDGLYSLWAARVDVLGDKLPRRPQRRLRPSFDCEKRGRLGLKTGRVEADDAVADDTRLDRAR